MQSGSSPIHPQSGQLGSSWKSLALSRYFSGLLPKTSSTLGNQHNWPAGPLCRATDRPLLVGIVDCDHAIQDVVRRLFTYMLLTGASFGVLVDGESIRWQETIPSSRSEITTKVISCRGDHSWHEESQLSLASGRETLSHPSSPRSTNSSPWFSSDEGWPLSSYLTFSVRDIQAALAPAYEALARIQARGLIHGDLVPLKILVRRESRSSQSSWVTIIGFSTASYVGPKEIHVSAGREMAKLQQCFEEVLMFVRAEEDMAVDRFLLALRKSSSIVFHKFPKICDLLNALGANLQGDDESSPKTDEASEASEMLSRYFKEYVVVDALTTPVDNPKLLKKEPRFDELRRFLAERRQLSSSGGVKLDFILGKLKFIHKCFNYYSISGLTNLKFCYN
ncbi:hypothetical protein SELMODRAFT_422475 [Selaginella moellendorffii]|uniref:Uncharacterized protein n=1 Tax=Selaginella moellendorffii TaxID=88036 RepID=D8SII0_SELML|nr:hypothetical protein SELMODRAFT_422475 [Selaginella moellendorffii]